jgi:mannitol/fructose-specific phosphotransferase system IIA component (Ntr-type)
LRLFPLEIFILSAKLHSMSYLSGLLRVEQIQLNLRGADKPAVLRELADLVAELKDEASHRDAFLQALLERERLHTTAIGDGIALPHARNPMGGLLKRPLLIFGRHSGGVQWSAPDNRPTQLFFLLASPQLTDHLAMLSRLSRVLRDAKLRSSLLTAAHAREIPGLLESAETLPGGNK